MQSNRLYGPAGTPGAAGSVALNTSGVAALPPLPAVQTILNTVETVILNPALTGVALILPIPQNGALPGQRFEVYASGYLNNGTNSTVTLRLYSGTSTTPGSNTLMSSSGATAAIATKVDWWVAASLIYSPTSGKISGTAKWIINNVIVAETAITNQPAIVIGPPAPGAVASFVLSAQFGTAGTQTIEIAEFAVNF
jgi:hypothetical protein